MTTRGRRPAPRSATTGNRNARFVAASVFFAALVLGVAAASAQATTEVLREIRVHGNYTTPDGEVIRLAGLALGQDLAPSSVADARARLERSRRFIAVDVRKRYRSLDDPSDVAVVIIVQEYPVSDAAPAALGALSRTLGSAMFMPVLNFTDGYGLTYGGRVSFVQGFGRGGRLSVPLTWGGTKRVAAEFETTMANAPIDAVTAAVSVSRRRNPYYEIDDDRRQIVLGVSRTITAWLRAGAQAGLAHVSFGNRDDRLTWYGGDVVLDTRADPVFPRNAVFATLSWRRLDFRSSAPANRIQFDARGYVGLIGQTVLSVRALYAGADAPLPPYERLLVGGADSLRGYRAGSFAGDAVAATSVELRIPTSSPLSFARAGVDVFADAGTAVDHGTPLRAAAFHPGLGGGVFMVASLFQFNADIGVRRGGGVRLHVMSGVRF